MDTDAQALDRALGVLHQQYGDRLAGSIGDTQAQMLRTLQQQMGVDEVVADRLVKELTHLGRLTYRGGNGGDGDDAGTGPVISMPGTTTGQSGEEFVVPAAGLAGAAGPDVASPPVGAAVAPAAVNSSMSAVTPTTGTGMAGMVPTGTSVSPSEANRATAENREGATMGQLSDTNVTGPTSPTEQVVARGDDDSEGYWQIG